jgi:hypothetical protein
LTFAFPFLVLTVFFGLAVIVVSGGVGGFGGVGATMV